MSKVGENYDKNCSGNEYFLHSVKIQFVSFSILNPDEPPSPNSQFSSSRCFGAWVDLAPQV